MLVGNKLAADLDRFLKNYLTHDRKKLTEGEVIVGLGFLLGRYLQDANAVQRWIMQISMAGLDAAKGK